MKTSKFSVTLAATLLFALSTFTGCESTDGGHTHTTVYTAGYYDPWYHGHYYDDGDIIVTPPPGNPPDQDLRPAHPIANPPEVSRPKPPPRPSIPTRPRPSPRGGGGRGGGRR